jgi:hypothetical protein
LQLGSRDQNLVDGVVKVCVGIHQSVEAKSKKFFEELRR